VLFCVVWVVMCVGLCVVCGGGVGGGGGGGGGGGKAPANSGKKFSSVQLKYS